MRSYIILQIFLFKWISTEEIYQNSSHICNTCNCQIADSFVLDCSNQNFQNVLANWPPHNKTLIGTFSYNNITTLEQLPITNQSAKLIFDHCNIQYLDSGAFSLVKHVEYIDLSYNLLTTEQISGDNFKGPYDSKSYQPIALKYLNLAYNQIHSLPQKFFENMPHLEELNLEGNDFVVLDTSTQVALGSLANIRILNLANNELTELEAKLVKGLHSLMELDLSKNHLDFVPMTLNYLSKNLKVLKLNDNYIFQLTSQSFNGLDLSEIYLNNLPRLKIVKANTFSTQKHLKKLHLSNNINLQVIDKDAFGDKQILYELDLSNNSLTAIDYTLDWSKLRIFKIDSNPLECTCELYNVTKLLPKSITRTLNSPICTYKSDDDISQTIYSLNEITCLGDHPHHISTVIKHFNKIRIVIIVLSIILSAGTGIVIALVALRYKRKVALRNYPFAAAVSYFPIQTQHI